MKNSSNSGEKKKRVVENKMAHLKEAEKQKMEQEFVERELGTLYELTFRLEDELNSIIVVN